MLRPMLIAVAIATIGVALAFPSGATAAACADHPNQASAQAAKDTRDADGDGIYCEHLPCPCAAPDPRATPPAAPAPTPVPPPAAPAPAPPVAAPPGATDLEALYELPWAPPTRATGRCSRTRRTIRVTLSKRRYPAVLAHMRAAIGAGFPRVLRLNRRGAATRRARLLAGFPARQGADRDEWPMAFARRTVKAHVAYIPAGQNRGAGARIGNLLRRYCDGVRFRVVGA